ncbi:hypothetical protein CDG76_34430 [Nostoc sp. 'Peltigera membranacea cyanobiont' 210A]|jgi:hypothetical protein|uniref:hypothetical protein n=1 Tax=unclassified Nostoc TaxID=2593658 RepID=UPI000B958057|nr:MULTISPECIES: hypothetical protein [unclassified Nostoc]MCW5318726.1 hypothetical protein [Nostoc sp. KVJ3]OYD89680.1 hypothetical protein CDG76_34430 [Nostoc sp. 'Peltigera membranacea cyanobiont' 210A]
MQQLTAILTKLKPKFVAPPILNFQPTQENASNLSFNTNLDSGTIAILEQIEAEYEYYQVCEEW